AAAQQAHVFIVSGDKDMMQAVNNFIKIYDPMKDVIIDKEYIMGRFEMPPERIAEIMALTGDAIDNVPGIKGIGEKTAKSLILKAGGLDSLLDHPERIENARMRKLIMENIEDIKFSRVLVTIDTDLPVEPHLQDLAVREPDWKTLLQLFTELEFRSLIKLIPRQGYAARGEYITITGGKQLQEFLGTGT
ncbi:MAG: 5'-3' exonuclease H3TH domain-containing protein, partial [Dissulfurispiraceae bacterium]